MPKSPVRQSRLIAAGFFLIVAGSSVAYEVEPLNAVHLIAACESYSNSKLENVDSDPEAVMCRSYLQGYFAATDEVVVIERIPSALTIRAMKTRGARITDDQKKAWKAAYCISEAETLKDIARKISAVEKTSAQEKTAQVLLRDMLAEHYACATLKQNSDQELN